LICTDFAPEMVAAARHESKRLGLANVEHRQIDAERIELDDDSVDGVLCRWGYMLMADPATALAESRRVLRTGGRLSLSVWGAAERNPWASLPAQALMQHTGAPPATPEHPWRPGAAGRGAQRVDGVALTVALYPPACRRTRAARNPAIPIARGCDGALPATAAGLKGVLVSGVEALIAAGLGPGGTCAGERPLKCDAESSLLTASREGNSLVDQR
jgi:SAM-dependent methyltransferase